jgi:putative hydrolase of HD superfamily
MEIVMEIKRLMETLHLAENLKNNTRHSWTSTGRHESVAEHCWRLTLMAYLVADEFPQADMNKVVKMSVFHDMGEAFTGDIPSFNQTKEDEERETRCVKGWLESLPEPFKSQLTELFAELEAHATLEAKIYKALDNIEAVLSHNEADISTWLENEYGLNLTYGVENAAFSPYLSRLRQAVKEETLRKMGK